MMFRSEEKVPLSFALQTEKSDYDAVLEEHLPAELMYVYAI